MARELDITIAIRNAEQAKAELARVDAEISKVTQSLLKGTSTLEEYEAAIAGLTEEQKKAKATLGDYEKTLKPVDEGQKKAASSASELVTAIGRLVTTGAVLGAIKQSLDYASSLEKMNAATGINVTGLQRLENVAIGASVSLNTITNSVLELTRRLVLDDKNAAKGMAALGLETQRFLRLDGEQQFYAIARSIKDITNEEERNAVAFQLFGRSYKEVLPALVADVDHLKDSIRGLTEQQVEDLARAEVAWQQWKATAARAIAEVVAAGTHGGGFGGFLTASVVAGAQRGMAERDDMRAQFAGATAAAFSGAPTIGGVSLPAFPDAGELLRLQQAGQANLALTREQATAENAAADARRKLAEATHALYSELRNMEGLVLMEQDRLRPLVQQAEAGTPLGGPLPGASTPGMNDLSNLFDAEVVAKIREAERAAHITAFGFKGMADELVNVGEKGTELDRIRKKLDELGKGARSIKGAFKELWQGMTGGEGLRGLFGNIGAGMVDQIGNMITGGISSLISGGLGWIVGQLGGPVPRRGWP
jgi:hypothetical protein